MKFPTQSFDSAVTIGSVHRRFCRDLWLKCFWGLLLMLHLTPADIGAQTSTVVTRWSNVRMADHFPGADAGGKIAAAIADLPSTGGTVDARGFEGAQTVATDIFTGVTKNVDLLFAGGTFSFSVNTSIPRNIALHLGRGTLLSVPTAVTLTIQGLIIAGPWQIFTTAGTGVVRPRATSAEAFLLQWWGALGDGANNDTAAIQAAIAAAEAELVAGRQGTVFCPPGEYNIHTGLTIGQAIRFYSSGGFEAPGCVLSKQTDIVGLTVTAGGGHISGVAVDGTDEPTSPATAHGVVLNDRTTFIGQANNNGGHGLFLDANTNLNRSFIQAVTGSNGGDGMRIEDNVAPTAPNTNVIKIDYLKSRLNGGDGLHILNGVSITGDLLTESNTGHGLHIEQTGTELNQGHIFWIHTEGNIGNDIHVIGASAADITLYVNTSASPISIPPDQNIALIFGYGGHTLDSRDAIISDAAIWRNANASDNSLKGVRHKVIGSGGVVLWQCEYAGSTLVTCKTDPAAARGLTGTYTFFEGIFTSSAGINPGTVTFAGLGTPGNGRIIYCSDCTIANPCAGAGTGALAKRINGAWVCN